MSDIHKPGVGGHHGPTMAASPEFLTAIELPEPWKEILLDVVELEVGLVQLVVAVVGDGGFQMTMPELATAAIHKLPIKILIINNRYLGMVRQWQQLFFDNRESGVDMMGNPDFVKIGEAYGIKGFHLRRTGDITKVLQKALDYNEGPCIIEAEVVKSDNVFPMIPAGAAVADMIIDEPPSDKKLEKPVGST